MTEFGRDFCGALRLGYGASGPWGMRWFEERRAAALIAAALDGGVSHFDTAAFYAAGEAERRLGAALRAVVGGKTGGGAGAFVSTKTGTTYRYGRAPLKDFSPAAIRRDVAASLARLGRERLDLLYLHGPGVAEIDAAADTLMRLKEEGLIERAGVCGAGAPLAHAVSVPAIDVVMAAYNVLDHRHGATFAQARARGMQVASIAPLAQALYARNFFRFRGAADAWRIARAVLQNRDELMAAQRIRDALSVSPGRTPEATALGFVLANADIDVAITTTTRLDHLRANIEAARRPLEPPELAALNAALSASAPDRAGSS